MDVSNMTKEEIRKLADEKGEALTDDELERVAGGAAWEDEDVEWEVTHEWVCEATNDRGCGQTFKTKERYLEYCPKCNAMIRWRAPE